MIFVCFVSRPEANPNHPNGAQAVAVFFVLSFRRLVADPLATLRDNIDEDQKLADRTVFPITLRNLGNYYICCMPSITGHDID